MTVCQNYFNMKIQKYKPGNQIIIFHDPWAVFIKILNLSNIPLLNFLSNYLTK